MELRRPTVALRPVDAGSWRAVAALTVAPGQEGFVATPTHYLALCAYGEVWHPMSVHDTDARIGEILGAVERAGVFDDTAFVLVADHGMQQTDPTVTGDWDVALRTAGIPFRDEGYSFLYLGDDLTG